MTVMANKAGNQPNLNYTILKNNNPLAINLEKVIGNQKGAEIDQVNMKSSGVTESLVEDELNDE